MNRIQGCLAALYGDEIGAATFGRLTALIEKYRSQIPAHPQTRLSHRDAILITYGDQLRAPNEPPLRTLAEICARNLRGLVSGVHILPFYPYSSDDGFSVIDYRAVDPALGTWDDIARVGEHFHLMFDLVANHVSVRHEWFVKFLRDDPRYRDYFLSVPPGADVSRVMRPRTLPLLTRFETAHGAENVWTTFSADQVDLNYGNPAVLLEIIDTLLFYTARGANLIRLDAIAFLWKEYGTACLHLPQTHRVIELLRAVLDQVAPDVGLVSETNVPHAENISYFGDGEHEAQMVYNFALPPLTLQALYAGDATALTRWARTLVRPSPHVTFFNFLASHDGIGLNPARGILRDDEIDGMVAQVRRHGGLVSYKNNPDGTASPYELNINLFDALNDPHGGESVRIQIDRFMAAQAIMLAMVGVPGIYFHSLFGSRGWPAGAERTKQNRTINREKLDRAELEKELADPRALRSQVFGRYAQLLRARATQPAFDPYAPMRVLDAGAAVFAVLRGEQVLGVHNVTNAAHPVALNISAQLNASRVTDLITGRTFDATRAFELSPYQVCWLARAS